MKLRDYQEKLIHLVRQEFAKGHRKIIAWLATGGGKCYCPDAEVIMFDGSIKKVKDIIVGDKLMGPDSKPRTVLATTKGFGQLYKVNPIKGDSHIFNEDHIFTLRASFNTKHYNQGELYDISLKDYVDSTKDTKRQLKWARSEGINFPEKEVFDPYLVGVYLGDGSRHCQSITNGDIEVQTYLEKICKSVYQDRKSCKQYRFNKEIKEEFKKCLTNGIEEKFIPDEYKINSRENRLKILAGLIDTDGYMHHNHWEITTKFPKLHDDILYLCRSLGFAAYSTIKKVKLKTWTESREYFRITISGDLTEVPIKVERKKTKSREQIKNVLNTGFKLEKIEKGEYAGFELDGDRRHLMSDFSITHNSAITIQLIKNLRENNKSVIFVVRRRQLVVETARKFEKMGIKCGIIMGNMKGFDDSLPVQVCSIDTVRPTKNEDGEPVLKDKHKFLLGFDSIVVDECLHKDTYVLTENKRAWKIERFERELKKDWPKVWTYNEKNGKKELKKVVRVIPRNKNNIWIISCTKTKIKCTDNHRFFTQRGWVRADNLTLNDGIFFTKKSLKENISCDFSRVKNIQINKEIEKTYDLEIEDNHNFFVNHSLNNNYFLLAHNCHDTTSPSYRNLFSLFKPETIFIGVTATPFQVGNKVHDFWETCVKSIEIKDLIDKGYLVKPRMFVPVEQDLSGIKTTGGDYNNKQLGEEMSKLNIIGDVIDNYKKYGENKAAICFAVNKQHSKILCEKFNANDIPAIHCDESTNQKDRDKAINDLKSGKIKVLCNVDIYSTGCDIPEAEIGILARPTRSETLFIQQAGRLLRPYRKCGRCKKQYDNSPSCPNCGYTEPEYIKEYAVLIDHGNNIQQHGTPLDIREAALTKEDLEKKKKKKKLEEKEPQIKAVKCKACFLIYDPSFDKCPSCGHVNEQKKIVHKKGELVELGDVEPEPIELKRMRGKLATLQKKQRLNGYKENYPYFKMYEHYGDKIYKYPELKIPTWIKRYAGKKKQEQEEADRILERLDENVRFF